MKNISELVEHYNGGKLAYILFTFLLALYVFIADVPHIFRFAPLALAAIPVFWEALKGLKDKKFGSELFFAVATVVGIIGDEEIAITIILLVVQVAEYFEHLIEERTEHAVESLLRLVPTDVILDRSGKEVTVPLAEVAPGMRIIVKTGSRIPVDGTILSGNASINEAALTGESVLLEKSTGLSVYAGTFVESGSVVIEAKTVGGDTMFGKIQKLLKDAGEKKPKIQLFADRLALILTPILAVFIGGVWIYTGDIKLVITLLVFGSPIELALVTPFAVMGGVVAAFNQGILVKNGLALEQFASVDTLIFDKTGTLTIGEPRVVGITTLDPKHSEEDIIRMAGIAEKRSGHPLSKAILEKAAEKGISIPDPDKYISVSGHGIEVDYKGEHYHLGSKHFIEEHGHNSTHIDSVPLCTDGTTSHTTFYLSCDKKLCGMICVADEVRSDASSTIEHLKESGFSKLILLSGDRDEVAKNVAKQLGIAEAYGEALPDKKLSVIEELQKNGHKVAMIGDGINDAPALRQADVGIAMGAMGMEPAIEASDIALLSNDLSKVVFLHDLSKKIFRTIRQNIILGLGFTHGFGMILALLHVLNPIQAAFFHAVPDLLILFNSARLIRMKPRELVKK